MHEATLLANNDLPYAPVADLTDIWALMIKAYVSPKMLGISCHTLRVAFLNLDWLLQLQQRAQIFKRSSSLAKSLSFKNLSCTTLLQLVCGYGLTEGLHRDIYALQMLLNILNPQAMGFGRTSSFYRRSARDRHAHSALEDCA